MLPIFKQLQEIFMRLKADEKADDKVDDKVDDEVDDKVDDKVDDETDDQPDTADIPELESEESAAQSFFSSIKSRK